MDMTAMPMIGGVTLPLMSLPASGLMLLLLLPAAALLGYRIGARRRGQLLAAGREAETLIGNTTLGAILALLGLLLAFSFGNALTIAQSSKGAMVEEASALGTVFLRVDYLPDPGRTELQAAILDYARTRVPPGDGALDTRERMAAFLGASLEAQARLWPLTLAATADPVAPPVQVFVAGAMNAALDAHLVRLALLSVPVSEVAQAMVLVAALAALLLLGNRAGMGGRPLNWRTFVFSGILFVVMLTILDVQRIGEGLIRLDYAPLLTTIMDMEMALAGRN
jgi:hypothetical protein